MHYFVNMGCLYIHVCLKMRLCLKHDFLLPVIFLYNVIRWSSHIYKKYCFFSFRSLLFLVHNKREVREWNWESLTLVNGMKNAIMQVTCFLNGSVVDILFYCQITTYWNKVKLKGYLATILLLPSKLPGNI